MFVDERRLQIFPSNPAYFRLTEQKKGNRRRWPPDPAVLRYLQTPAFQPVSSQMLWHFVVAA